MMKRLSSIGSGGLFNVKLKGKGCVAILSDGKPRILMFKTLLGRGSGQSFQIKLDPRKDQPSKKKYQRKTVAAVEFAWLVEEYGNGELRLTVEQNIIIPNIPDSKIAELRNVPLVVVLIFSLSICFSDSSLFPFCLRKVI
ncbi:hypothetical protein R1flu_004716 [Riccia fluitans]|uniref:Nitrite/Sulfite reductase ferredoxin-like domain-containing protein n=1 Tax=Riccia fluitans TaxID=41844 RepID=A0ABD1YU62_9MARC